MSSIKGCRNHGCVIEAPRGMATNGPCKCVRDVLGSPAIGDDQRKHLRREWLKTAYERRFLRKILSKITSSEINLNNILAEEEREWLAKEFGNKEP